MKVYINENQKRLLAEQEYNYHFDTHGKKHDGTPYGSDSKYSMDGRGTGHFGSGTYFSTYKEESPSTDAKYGELHPNKDGHFIQLDDKVYRVDLSLYHNLYRVHSERQADVLYSLLRYVNQMFTRITSFGKLDNKSANYDNADLYQKIERNADALNLKCPSYMELTRMAQELGKNDSRKSFSTMFMEYNGYNGVNVTGIPKYDNTMHGSVIYDLSKVEGDMAEQSNTKPLWRVNGLYQNTTVPNPKNGDLFDDELDALYGEYVVDADKLNKMPLPRAMRILKNLIKGNGRILDQYSIMGLDETLQKRYLNLLYKANKDNVDVYSIIKPILKNKAYYWVNYLDEPYKKSGLIAFLRKFEFDLDWDASDEENDKKRRAYFHNLMLYMHRELSWFEEAWLNDNGYIVDNPTIKENKTNELSIETFASAASQAFDNDDERTLKFRNAACQALEKDYPLTTMQIVRKNNDDEFLQNHRNIKITSFDTNYKTLDDLYKGVKRGKLLIHCRRMLGHETDEVIYPEIGDTVQEVYGEYADEEEYGEGLLKELVFASDNFNWARDTRNGVYFVYSDSFLHSLGDSIVQEPNGEIYSIDDSELSASIEQGDWFSPEPVSVAAILNTNSAMNEERTLNEEKSISKEVTDISRRIVSNIINHSAKQFMAVSPTLDWQYAEGNFDVDLSRYNISPIHVYYLIYKFESERDIPIFLKLNKKLSFDCSYDEETRQMVIITYVCNGYFAEDFEESVMHETTHMFQYGKGMEKRASLYKNAIDLMQSPQSSQLERYIGELLYHSFPHEQDAFVHQFFQHLFDAKGVDNFHEALKVDKRYFRLAMMAKYVFNNLDDSIIEKIGFDRASFKRRIMTSLSRLKRKYRNAYTEFMRQTSPRSIKEWLNDYANKKRLLESLGYTIKDEKEVYKQELIFKF